MSSFVTVTETYSLPFLYNQQLSWQCFLFYYCSSGCCPFWNNNPINNTNCQQWC